MRNSRRQSKTHRQASLRPECTGLLLGQHPVGGSIGFLPHNLHRCYKQNRLVLLVGMFPTVMMTLQVHRSVRKRTDCVGCKLHHCRGRFCYRSRIGKHRCSVRIQIRTGNRRCKLFRARIELRISMFRARGRNQCTCWLRTGWVQHTRHRLHPQTTRRGMCKARRYKTRRRTRNCRRRQTWEQCGSSNAIRQGRGTFHTSWIGIGPRLCTHHRRRLGTFLVHECTD